MALPTSLASRNGDEHGSRRCLTPGASEFQGCERRAKAVGLADGDVGRLTNLSMPPETPSGTPSGRPSGTPSPAPTVTPPASLETPRPNVPAETEIAPRITLGLKGDQGDPGPEGPTGPKGKNGETGESYISGWRKT